MARVVESLVIRGMDRRRLHRGCWDDRVGVRALRAHLAHGQRYPELLRAHLHAMDDRVAGAWIGHLLDPADSGHTLLRVRC